MKKLAQRETRKGKKRETRKRERKESNARVSNEEQKRRGLELLITKMCTAIENVTYYKRYRVSLHEWLKPFNSQIWRTHDRLNLAQFRPTYKSRWRGREGVKPTQKVDPVQRERQKKEKEEGRREKGRGRGKDRSLLLIVNKFFLSFSLIHGIT